MERCMVRGQCLAGAEEQALHWLKSRQEIVQRLVEGGEIMTLNLFKWQEQFFLYYECTDRLIPPETLWGDGAAFLRVWPGAAQERQWVPMIDIYHVAHPVSVEHWRRKQPVQRVTGRVMQLKPEMVSSYVFYHYQLQEERIGARGKYAVIYLTENLVFMYTEHPDPAELPPYKGKLDTTNTPSNWEDFMLTHCIPWQETGERVEKMWRHGELVLRA